MANKASKKVGNKLENSVKFDLSGDSVVIQDNEYYQVLDRGDLAVKKGKARYEITIDGKVVMVPYSDSDYFIKNRQEKTILDKNRAHYEITKNGDLIVVPNDKVMSDVELYV